jgi:hypothetical protein
LKIDHGVDNAVVESSDRSSWGKGNKEVDFLSQVQIAGETSEALCCSLGEANVGQGLTLGNLQCIVDAGRDVVSNEVINAEIPVLVLVGAVLAMLVRIRVSSVISKPDIKTRRIENTMVNIFVSQGQTQRVDTRERGSKYAPLVSQDQWQAMFGLMPNHPGLRGLQETMHDEDYRFLDSRLLSGSTEGNTLKSGMQTAVF